MGRSDASRPFHCKGHLQHLLKTRITSQMGIVGALCRSEDSVRLYEGEYNCARAQPGAYLLRRGPELESFAFRVALETNWSLQTVATKSLVFSRLSLYVIDFSPAGGARGPGSKSRRPDHFRSATWRDFHILGACGYPASVPHIFSLTPFPLAAGADAPALGEPIARADRDG